jgi:IS30 family transposase
MARWRRSLKPPGGPPLTDKRALYIKLMNQGENNSAACRAVGINRKTGCRWLHGRTVQLVDGRDKTYPSILRSTPAFSARFLSESERVVIADGLAHRLSIRSIAAGISRSPSTVSREIRRNRDPETARYRPFAAHRQAARRRARSRPGKLAWNAELRDFVASCLKVHWSPEQISARLVRAFPERPDMRIAPETIYRALYSRESGLSLALARSLRTGRTRRKPHRRPDRRTSRQISGMRTIRERPAEAINRTVPGHWEGDLIMGRANRTAIGTLVERTTRYLVLLPLSGGHGSERVRDALIAATDELPRSLARSLAWDRGLEMRRHFEFTRSTDIPVYFCDPASPWQRGSNENTNGLLRQYFPKSTDLRAHTAERIAQVAAELNSRPRKSLGWDTPAERLAMLLESSP